MGLNIIKSVIYASDFGIQSTINFKITDGAFIPSGFYDDKIEVACGSSSAGFKMRYLTATFDGSNGTLAGKFQYPIPNRQGTSGIAALARALLAGGAICIDLEGEKWANVTNRALNDSPTYRTTPYTLDVGKAKQTYNFAYASDLTNKNESVRKSFEVNNAELLAAQIGCLITPEEATVGGLCSISQLGIKPRHFGLKATAKKQGSADITATVNRQVIVSNEATEQIQNCGVNTAPKAFCFTYKGESARNIQNIISLN